MTLGSTCCHQINAVALTCCMSSSMMSSIVMMPRGSPWGASASSHPPCRCVAKVFCALRERHSSEEQHGVLQT